jgi:xylan 1,4-beta-xylosidase
MPADPWSIADALTRLEPPRIPDRTTRAALPAEGDALPALTAAIAAAHAAGGGRVVVGRGRHLLRGSLVLRDRVEVHLEDGATLAFSGEPGDFLPPAFQRWEGTECWSHAPLITARDATDIALTGSGTIDGGGSRAFTAFQPIQDPDKARLRDMGHRGVPVDQRVFGAGTHLRPSLFQPLGCARVLLQGVTLTDSPFWVIHPTYCRQVIVRGVTVDSRNPNNDGCDPDSCEDVLVEDCTFRTGDDGVAIKSGRDEDAWRVGRPTRRVLVRRCVLDSEINGLCIGSEMGGGVADIFMEDCRIDEADSVLYLKGSRERGGFITDIHMRRIAVGRARQAAIRFEPTYKGVLDGEHPPEVARVRISEVTCRQADRYALVIDGDPRRPVRDVHLDRVVIDRAAETVWLRHADQVRCTAVTVNGAAVPEFPPAAPAEAVLAALRA